MVWLPLKFFFSFFAPVKKGFLNDLAVVRCLYLMHNYCFGFKVFTFTAKSRTERQRVKI